MMFLAIPAIPEDIFDTRINTNIIHQAMRVPGQLPLEHQQAYLHNFF